MNTDSKLTMFLLSMASFLPAMTPVSGQSNAAPGSGDVRNPMPGVGQLEVNPPGNGNSDVTTYNAPGGGSLTITFGDGNSANTGKVTVDPSTGYPAVNNLPSGTVVKIRTQPDDKLDTLRFNGSKWQVKVPGGWADLDDPPEGIMDQTLSPEILVGRPDRDLTLHFGKAEPDHTWTLAVPIGSVDRGDASGQAKLTGYASGGGSTLPDTRSFSDDRAISEKSPPEAVAEMAADCGEVECYFSEWTVVNEDGSTTHYSLWICVWLEHCDSSFPDLHWNWWLWWQDVPPQSK